MKLSEVALRTTGPKVTARDPRVRISLGTNTVLAEVRYRTIAMAASSSAPRYIVPRREIVAVEHPMVVKNIDNALKTFGTGVPLKEVRPL